MIPSTPSYPLARAVAANVTAAAFTALGVANQNPTANLANFPGAFSFSTFVDADVGKIDVVGNAIFFQIIGTGADNDTLTLRLTGWRPFGTDQWIAETLCEVTATLCAAVGVAGKDLLNTDRLADAIVKVTGPDNMQVKSFTDNRPGSVLVDALGCPILQIQSQTKDANILWAPL